MLQCRPQKADFTILTIFFGCFAGIYSFLWIAGRIIGEDLQKVHWTLGLAANVLGYSAFLSLAITFSITSEKVDLQLQIQIV